MDGDLFQNRGAVRAGNRVCRDLSYGRVEPTGRRSDQQQSLRSRRDLEWKARILGREEYRSFFYLSSKWNFIHGPGMVAVSVGIGVSVKVRVGVMLGMGIKVGKKVNVKV